MNNERHRISRHQIIVLKTPHGPGYYMIFKVLPILIHLLLFTVHVCMYNIFCAFSSHLNSNRQHFFSSECPLGYRGSECFHKCTFPLYGQNCDNICRCTDAQCDFQFGCKLSSSSGIITLRCVNFTTSGTTWNKIYKFEFENASILPKVLNINNWKALIKKYNKTTFSLKKQKIWFKQLVFRLLSTFLRNRMHCKNSTSVTKYQILVNLYTNHFQFL